MTEALGGAHALGGLTDWDDFKTYRWMELMPSLSVSSRSGTSSRRIRTMSPSCWLVPTDWDEFKTYRPAA